METLNEGKELIPCYLELISSAIMTFNWNKTITYEVLINN